MFLYLRIPRIGRTTARSHQPNTVPPATRGLAAIYRSSTGAPGLKTPSQGAPRLQIRPERAPPDYSIPHLGVRQGDVTQGQDPGRISILWAGVDRKASAARNY